MSSSTTQERTARAAPFLAGCIVALAGLFSWATPYVVEPEMTLLPWLVNNGWYLYKDAINQHPPLLIWLIAALTGGDPGWPLHALVTAVHIATLMLTYVVGSKLLSPAGGLIALILAEVWGVGFNSASLWYDSVLAPFYLGVLLLVVLYQKEFGGAQSSMRSSIYLAAGAGLLLGIGLGIKQHVIIAVPFVVLAIWHYREGRTARLGAFAVGLTLPLVMIAIVFAMQGTLDEAWYWVVAYSLTGNYAQAAALAPPTQYWVPLVGFCLPLLALAAVLPRYLAHKTFFPTGITFAGLLVASLLPVYPRFGAFHLQSAVPLLAIASGAAIMPAWHALRSAVPKERLLGGLSVSLIATNAVVGVWIWAQVLYVDSLVGGPTTPYAATLAPLSAWVDTHATHNTIFIYGLDSTLYRVLEEQPPKPWIPQLSWILQSHNSEERLWDGVEQVRPEAALVAASAWDSFPTPGPEPGPARLHRDYHEAARFQVAPYPQSPSVGVVALLRNDNAGDYTNGSSK